MSARIYMTMNNMFMNIYVYDHMYMNINGNEHVYRLEHDMSWTEEKDMEKRGNEMMLINKILDAGTNVSFNFLPSQYQVFIL